MESRAGINKDEAGALLSWWRDAGVDVAVQDAAPSWREVAGAATAKRSMPVTEAEPVAEAADPVTPPQARPARPAPSQPAPEPAKIGPIPDTLDAIADWYRERSKTLAARHVEADLREAPLLVMTGRPDGDALYGEAQATLLARMLAAIDQREVAHAAIDPAFLEGGAPTRRVDAEAARAACRVAALLKPERLLLFGDAAARALLDTPLRQARGKIHDVEGIRTVATFHPRWLLERPADKRLAWEDLLLLTSKT